MDLPSPGKDPPIRSARPSRRSACNGRSAALGRPGDLTALVELPIPASWSKRRNAAAIVGSICPTSRPDIDNYLKSAMDAINGIVVADDSLIVKVAVEKKFGVDPKLVLLVTPIDAATPIGRHPNERPR